MVFSRIKIALKKLMRSSDSVVEQGRSSKDIFGNIYHENYWGNEDSRSGAGSDLEQTVEVRKHLPGLFKEMGVQSILDIPCGDWHWMKDVDIDVIYTGADIVPEMIQRNKESYESEWCHFDVLDMTRDQLPEVDLIFSRDVLVHLSYEDIIAAISNMKSSGATYLLTTTFIDRASNFDIPTGHWRPINLQKAPFNFPAPIKIIDEKCTEGDGSWGDKSLALWKLSDLPVGES
ncbi:MAG: class I SAM-dependent methyltransferase [Mariprofundus sp.]|nr:class I SAM-dependent methyltransferase [Mariprofundus sp.]